MTFWICGLIIVCLAILSVLFSERFRYRKIYSAVKRGETSTIKDILKRNSRLINAKDNDGLTPLHYAVTAGRKELVSLLLARGADVNARDNRGATPLHLAVDRVQREIAHYLISRGADINARTNNGKTALAWAQERGHSEMAEFLRRYTG
jgi:ankyrin repeat protein